MGLYVGIDIGTSGTKTILIDGQGKVVAEATAGHPISHPKPMWSEQNPDDWWRAVVQTVQQAVKKSRAKSADIKAIGLSGQMHGAVLLDKNQKLLRPAILWNDQRTAAECKQIEVLSGGKKKLVSMVANPALTGFTAPKILWVRNNEPRKFEKMAHVLLPKDEIRRRLTGDFATDVSDASGTLLLDIKTRIWSKKLLGLLDLDPGLFPKCYESEDVTGRLTRAAATELGLSTDCLVVGGAGDCAAGAIGTGVVESGIVNSSIGTSSVVFVHCDEFRPDPNARLHTFCHAVRNKWHQMGVTLTGGGAMEWFRNELCGDKKASGKRSVYQMLDEEAAAVPAGSEGLFFLPYLAGERTPHADPNARGCMVGLTLSHKRGHIVRSIMEGVTMAMRDSVEIMRDLKIPVQQVRATGGGAASRLWMQMQADIFDSPISTINSSQGAALGVALLAATGAGEFKNVVEACKATVKTVETVRPNKAAVQNYNARFPLFQQLYKSLKQDFQSIAALR